MSPTGTNADHYQRRRNLKEHAARCEQLQRDFSLGLWIDLRRVELDEGQAEAIAIAKARFVEAFGRSLPFRLDDWRVEARRGNIKRPESLDDVGDTMAELIDAAKEKLPAPEIGYVSKQDLDAVAGNYVAFATIQKKYKPKAAMTGRNNCSMYEYSYARSLYLKHDQTLSMILPDSFAKFQAELARVQQRR